MNKTILVTGASGFVGAHIAIGLARFGYQVAALGGKNCCPDEVLRMSSFADQADLSSAEDCRRVVRTCRPQIVVHAAALANANVCEQNPQLAASGNVTATKLLTAALRESGPPELFVQISTDLVFDGGTAPHGGFSEEHAICPTSCYGRTKADAEVAALASGIPATVMRISLVYGEKIQSLEGFMGWLRGNLSRGEPVSLFSDEFRTPVYAGDITRALDALIGQTPSSREAALRGADGQMMLHLGGSERVSRLEFGYHVAEVFSFRKETIVASTRDSAPSLAPRPRDVSLSSRKVETALGLTPLAIRAGLEQLKARSVGTRG